MGWVCTIEGDYTDPSRSPITLEGGDPDALDIWYYLEGAQPLELPGLDKSWPLDQPYQWDAAQPLEQ